MPQLKKYYLTYSSGGLKNSNLFLAYKFENERNSVTSVRTRLYDVSIHHVNPNITPNPPIINELYVNIWIFV